MAEMRIRRLPIPPTTKTQGQLYSISSKRFDSEFSPFKIDIISLLNKVAVAVLTKAETYVPPGSYVSTSLFVKSNSEINVK